MQKVLPKIGCALLRLKIRHVIIKNGTFLTKEKWNISYQERNHGQECMPVYQSGQSHTGSAISPQSRKGRMAFCCFCDSIKICFSPSVFALAQEKVRKTKQGWSKNDFNFSGAAKTTRHNGLLQLSQTVCSMLPLLLDLGSAARKGSCPDTT